ncbi:MAG: hypothetical protein U0452_06200 [Anaerolineae bacterium]
MIRRLLAPWLVLTLVISAIVLGTAHPAYALSSGCTGANFTDSLASISLLGQDFVAGEHLVVTVSNPSTNTQATLQVNSVLEDVLSINTGQSVTLEYTFPADGTYDVVVATISALATQHWSCSVPTVAAPSRPAPGPSIPDGFVLRQVTCDTLLYATPDGIPVLGGAAVTSGQTWFVAPEASEEHPDWIEGFFGGFTNAWLPAACVS